MDLITATASDVRNGKVIVDKDGNPLTGTMAEQAGGTYTPGTANKTLIPANTFATSDVIMKGDPNLIAANLKKGVSIFGVSGNFEGWITEDTNINFNTISTYGIYVDVSNISGSMWTIVTNNGNEKLKGGIFQMPFSLLGYKELIVEFNKHNTDVPALTCGLYKSAPVVDQSFYTNRIAYGSGSSTITIDVRKISDRPYVVLGNDSWAQGGYNITRIYAKKYNE